MALLKDDYHWLAWSLADSAHEYLESSSLLMFQMNSAYARKKIAAREHSKVEFVSSCIPSVADGDSVRYHILRRSLLEDWTDGIEDLIEKALLSKNMSEKEFKNWPALEYLRNQTFYKNVMTRLGNREHSNNS
ncbi:MAG: hypothetical protein GY762_10290 [Proteobacteria bacterium]|nr:hypothetical protein [Pseudomonadota bacterium]